MKQPRLPLNGCRECGGRCARLFCSMDCRRVWHNRRKSRGADMYDLVMALRYERDTAKADSAWTVLCNVARAAREADVAARGGRQSWNLQECLARLPAAFSDEGDGR